MSKELKTIVAEAITDSILPITEFADRELAARDCPVRQLMQIRVAIDEIISNIAYYAYPGKRGKVTVSFAFEEESRTAVLTFTDSGIPYDPLQYAEADVSLPASKRQIGGLGIFLVRKTMDSVSYRRENGMNILCIRKQI